MLETLAEIPSPLKLVAVFVGVIALIIIFAWALRRFGGERFGGTTARGRQPRLAVVDAAAIDSSGRRRLVIIRRDNVEHLLMIGGPNDLVVETNIVRTAARDKASETTFGRAALTPSETFTRPVPLGEGALFPLQPAAETNGRPARPAPEEPAQWTWPAHSEPQRPAEPQRPVEPPRPAEPPRPVRAEPRLEKPEKTDTLSSLAEELSGRSPTPRESAPPREPAFTRPNVMPPTPRPAPVQTPTPTVAAPLSMPPASAPAPVEKVEKKVEKTAAEADQNLADMATLLGASLRRAGEARIEPPSKTEPMIPPAPPRMTPPLESRLAPEPRIPTPEPRGPAPEPRITPAEPRATAPEPKPPLRTEAKPVPPAETKSKTLYDSLEEEMASLLGRPPGKP